MLIFCMYRDPQKIFCYKHGTISFQVESSSLYVKEEFGDMAYWPNDGGRFNVMHLSDGTSLQVKGEGLQADQLQRDVSRQFQQSQQGPPFSGFSYTGNRAGPVPFVANYSAPLFAGNTKKNKAIAKVILAEGNKTDKGGTTFRELGQTYVNIRKIQLTSRILHPKFETPVATKEFFTSNGLKVNDTEGTRGKYHLYSM